MREQVRNVRLEKGQEKGERETSCGFQPFHARRGGVIGTTAVQQRTEDNRARAHSVFLFSSHLLVLLETLEACAWTF